MEELKPVPAREMLREAHVQLQGFLLLTAPKEFLVPGEYEVIVKAAAAIKLLWEANRGY